LGDHTAHHSGAKSIEEVTKEIGDCAVHLQKVYGSKPRLISFATPGGVPWSFTASQLAPIFDKYQLIPTYDRNFFDEKQVDPVIFVQKAIENHAVGNVCMHGTGGEWLSTSLPTLTRLLDFLVAHRPNLWIAPLIEIHKYVQERDAAKPPTLTGVTSRGFSVGVVCSLSKLYDQPLTVEVAVPDSWRAFKVKQGALETHHPVQAHLAKFEVQPNSEPAKVTMEG
jgi:hypothetical protein